MSELAAGLAASANEPVAESAVTPDAVLDAVFDAPSEPAAGSEPPTTPDSVNQPAAAIAQPQVPATTEGAGKGEPPRERWDSILANARNKAREDALAEHREHLEIVAEMKRDLPGTLGRLLEEGSADPRFAEALTAKAAAILSARKQEAKANAEPEPDLQTADGELVYSAGQLRKWNEWNGRQTEARYSEKFKPLQELTQLVEQHKQHQRDTEEVAQAVSTRWAEWESMPFLKENMEPIKVRQAEVFKELQAQAAESGQRFDVKNAPFQALSIAYREIVSSQVLPKLQSQQTNELVASAARKRAGSSSDPAASAPAQPRKPRTPDEALEQAFSGLGV